MTNTQVRERKRNFDEFTHDHDEHEGMDDAALKEHEEVTKVKNVNKIQMGKFLVETWYFSPLPREVWKQGDEVIDVLYFCEFSLNFYRTKEQLRRHQAKDEARGAPRYPPGDEIYRCGKVSVFEVDGQKSKLWCQNLCYIAKVTSDRLCAPNGSFVDYALARRCSWTTRHCTMTWIRSSFTSSVRATTRGIMLWGTFPRRRRAKMTTTWHAF